MHGAWEADDARGPRRILVGGDDPAIVDLLEHVLSLEGYAVQAVVGRAHVVTVVRQQPPALVVLHVDWEHLTGQLDYPVLDALRADPHTAQVPVVTLSTRPDRAEAALTSYTVKATSWRPLTWMTCWRASDGPSRTPPRGRTRRGGARGGGAGRHRARRAPDG